MGFGAVRIKIIIGAIFDGWTCLSANEKVRKGFKDTLVVQYQGRGLLLVPHSPLDHAAGKETPLEPDPNLLDLPLVPALVLNGEHPGNRRLRRAL